VGGASFIVWVVPFDEQETSTIATTQSTETRMIDFFMGKNLIVSALDIQSHCAVRRKASCARFTATCHLWIARGERWIADAHRDDGKRFVVRADEKLSAFLELEAAIGAAPIWNRNYSLIEII
jgi:hypothetical protein